MSHLLSPGERQKSHPENRRKWPPAGRQMRPWDTGKRENFSFPRFRNEPSGHTYSI